MGAAAQRIAEGQPERTNALTVGKGLVRGLPRHRPGAGLNERPHRQSPRRQRPQSPLRQEHANRRDGQWQGGPLFRTRRGGRQRCARLRRAPAPREPAVIDDGICRDAALVADPHPRRRVVADTCAQTASVCGEKYISEARNQRGVETWTASQLGASRCKALDIGPDAVVQLAIQLATSEVLGEMPAIFEPVPTRHFAGGRMDFIVPATIESLAAVRALRDPATSPYSAAAHLRRAAKAHQNQILRAKSGRGLVAHLLALNAVQAEEAGSKGAEMSPWRHRVLPHLDKGVTTLLHQDVLAANGSGHQGVASFSPIGPRPHMLSSGYVIKEYDITIDIRADGRFSAHTRALRAALDQALADVHEVLSTSTRNAME